MLREGKTLYVDTISFKYGMINIKSFDHNNILSYFHEIQRSHPSNIFRYMAE